MDLYVGIAKCLSEMSDTEIDRIAQVTEVQYVVIITVEKYSMVSGLKWGKKLLCYVLGVVC